MKINRFITVGENIHCTRVFKVGGKMIKKLDDGTHAVIYKSGDKPAMLPIPERFVGGADWESGKVKHCAVAIWQANYGDGDARTVGIDYLHNLARNQARNSADYLDINVDEFSTDVAEKIKILKWTVGEIQKAVNVPVSIDSSNMDILKAGLEACDHKRGKPMVNSVSLERLDTVRTAAAAKAVVIASAAGRSGLPSTVQERLQNIAELFGELGKAGFVKTDIHFDPLVFPISTDGKNGTDFLETVRGIRTKYGADVHIVAGLSNVSFGMPNRKLINQVFSWLAVEAGADGGIVDPAQINRNILSSMDPKSNDFKLARALLLGEDEFGMNFINAFRGGEGA